MMEINEKHAAKIVKHAFDTKDDFERIDLVSGIDKQRIPIHPIVLSATSKYFAELLRPTDLNEKPQEFVLADVDGGAIKTVVDYCYSGNIVLTEKNLAKCLKIATDSEMESLADECREYYASKLSIESAVEVLMEADKYNLDDLRQRASELIGSQLDKVLVADILQLNHSMMALLLEKGGTSDLLVKRLIEWFEHDEVGRGEHMPKLLRLIKLEQLTMEFLGETVEPIFERFKCSKLFVNEYKSRALSNTNSIATMRDSLKAPQGNEGKHSEKTSIFSVRIKEETGCHTTITVEKYDESSNRLLTQGSSFSISAKSFGTVLYENQIIVIGGQYNEHNIDYGKQMPTTKNYVIAYNLNTRSKEYLTSMKANRCNFASTLMEKWIYVFGGQNCCTCERYDTVAKTWEAISSMSQGRRSASAAILNELIYVVGGINNSNELTLVEAYDPKTNEWAVKMSFDAVASRVRPMLVAFNGFLYAFPDKRGIRQYDSENKICAEIRPSIDHNIRSIIAANGRLFTITTNGSYGYVTIDGPKNKIAFDYRGETKIPNDLSDTHYITLHQCRCE